MVKKSRAVLKLWLMAGASLVLVGILSFLYLLPLMRARTIVRELQPLGRSRIEEIDDLAERLGGKDRVLSALSIYLNAPESIASEKWTAAVALCALGSSDAYPLLEQRMLDQSGPFGDRLDVVSAVQQGKNLEGLVLLGLAVHDRNRRVRSRAAEALAGYRSPLASKLALCALLDRRPVVATYGARYFRDSNRGDVKLSWLIDCLRDIEKALLEIRKEFGVPKSWPIEFQKFGSSLYRDHARSQVMAAVSQTAAVDDIEYLVTAAKDENEFVRSASARGLGEVGRGSAKALEVLSALREDPKPIVRYEAREALEKLEKAQQDRGGGKGSATLKGRK